MKVPDLPPPRSNQAYCDVSALEGGVLKLPCALMVSTAAPDETLVAPALSFLLTHSGSGARMLFDLGICKDIEGSLTPTIVDRAKKVFNTSVPQDVPESLSKGGLTPDDVECVCLSHVHWDHVGDPSLFKNAKFLLGADARSLFHPGYPEDPQSVFRSDLLPIDRTEFLDPSNWAAVGPFPRAFDYYGDGSLFIIDAPGHLPGHINILARTSQDGAWIYLAGDSAHDWRLIRGQGEIAVLQDEHGGTKCMHRDREQAEATIRRITDVLTLPRVQVILAHDAEWYEKNKGGGEFWPGRINSS